MLLKLDPQVERSIKGDQLDIAHQQAVSYAKYHYGQAKLLEEDTLNPSIWEKQKGQTMTHQQLLKLLHKINPNFAYEPVPPPGNPNCLRLILPSWPERIFCLVQKGEMPEYSFMSTKEEEVYDPSYFPTASKPGRTVDRADMPQGELQRDDVTGHMKWVYPPGTARPGMKLVRKPWNETIRGWRTVLAACVERRLVSPEHIETLIRDFGLKASINKSWAAHTKRNVISPW